MEKTFHKVQRHTHQEAMNCTFGYEQFHCMFVCLAPASSISSQCQCIDCSLRCPPHHHIQSQLGRVVLSGQPADRPPPLSTLHVRTKHLFGYLHPYIIGKERALGKQVVDRLSVCTFVLDVLYIWASPTIFFGTLRPPHAPPAGPGQRTKEGKKGKIPPFLCT